MKLTILGSGTYQPELERHSAGYLLEVGNQKICFDFGRSAIDQLLKMNIQITEIDAVFLTHWHGDHVTDLIPLIHYTTAPLPEDISTIRPVREKPLKIYGPKGTLDNLKTLLNIIRYGKTDFRNMEVVELSEEEIKTDNYSVKSFLTLHKPNALCYRLESNGKVLAYSGDSIETDGLKKAIDNADLAVVEVSWPESVNPKSHLTGQKAGKIAESMKVKKLILTHVSPYYLKNFDPVADAKKYFKGEVELAKDLLILDI